MAYKRRPTFIFRQFLGLSLVLIMASVTYFVANNLIKRQFNYSASAAAGTANLFFEPTSLTLPPNGKVNLWVTSDKPVGFVAVDVTFDKAKVQLAQEITLTNSVLTRKIKVSSMAEANTSGKLTVVLGIDPTAKASAPAGNFAFASVTFKPMVTTNLTTGLSYTLSASQLVDLNAIPFTLSSSAGSLVLNPPASPTPTPTSTPTPTTPQANSSPVITTISLADATAGSWIRYKQSLSGYDANISDYLTFSASGLPRGLSLGNCVRTTSTSSSLTCQISGRPKSKGTYTVTVKLWDNQLATATQTYQLVVK